MILNSKYNGFIFNFTKGFIDKEIEDRWTPFVKRMPLAYDTVHNYVNSTVQSVNFPSITMETVQQWRGNEREKEFKSSKAVKDLFSREMTVTFKTTEGFTNYWIMHQNIQKYLSHENKEVFMPDLYLRMMDHDGHIMSTIRFVEVIFVQMSDLTLSYADNTPELKTFDMSFRYNDIKIEIETA